VPTLPGQAAANAFNPRGLDVGLTGFAVQIVTEWDVWFVGARIEKWTVGDQGARALRDARTLVELGICGLTAALSWS